MPADAPRLVADIGGTNARFALAAPDGTLHATAVFANRDHASLEHAARAFLRAQPVQPRSACLAVAAPVDGDRVSLVNHSWQFSASALRDALCLERLRVINDFEAIAHALPRLGEEDLAGVGDGTAVAGAPVVVMGPGTGLGLALVVPEHGGPRVVPTEGGHACLGARDAAELQILSTLIAAGHYTSRELLLCGSGLELLHRLLAGDAAPALSAAEIQARAVDGSDAGCTTTLAQFCAFLGTAAGDAALGCGARGGVYLAGGIVPRFVAFLRASRFRERFDSRGPMSGYARRIPVHVITHANPGLLGAALAPLETA